VNRIATVLFSVVLPLTTLAEPTRGKPMSDEEQLHGVHEEFASGWSRGDAEAVAQFWTEDGVRVGAGGDIQHGRKEIAAALDRLLNGPLKGAKVSFDRGAIRMLGPDLALYQGPMEIQPGAGRPPIKGYFLDVMKKVQGKWLMLEGHPKLFPPPPGSGTK
jgi:uncharacterized protein (TIGR02246 family)